MFFKKVDIFLNALDHRLTFIIFDVNIFLHNARFCSLFNRQNIATSTPLTSDKIKYAKNLNEKEKRNITIPDNSEEEEE